MAGPESDWETFKTSVNKKMKDWEEGAKKREKASGESSIIAVIEKLEKENKELEKKIAENKKEIEANNKRLENLRTRG